MDKINLLHLIKCYKTLTHILEDKTRRCPHSGIGRGHQHIFEGNT